MRQSIYYHQVGEFNESVAMQVRFGYRDIEYPSAALGKLLDSEALIGDVQSLRARLRADGYLLLRGAIDRDTVLNARETVLAHMAAQRALAPDTPLLEGVMPPGGRGVPMMGVKGIAYRPEVLAVLEHSALFALFKSLFGESALTYPFKWLRAVGNEQYTGAHFDFVYMGRGSKNLHTVWIPFGDMSARQGTLAICRGSHNLSSFAHIRDTYGQMDVDRDGIDGWFERDPLAIVERFGGQWLCADYRAGDVIIFGMHAMHASTTNLTDRFRLSCDVRYQPASEPVDERWKRGGRGHYNRAQSDINAARAEWGV